MKSRNTTKQAQVMEILSQADKALSADEILDLMPEKINKTTAYRMLERFSQSGIVHGVVGAEGKSYYALCEEECNSEKHSHHHIHFQCRQCQSVLCLSEEVYVPELPGFKVEDAQFMVMGLCTDCNS